MNKGQRLDLITVVLLLLGLLVLGVGWLIGLALLWASPTWRLRDKLLGTLVVPGGLPFAFLLAAFGVPASVGWHANTPAMVIQAVVLFAPLYTAAHLTRRLLALRHANGAPLRPA
jgi:hypothetical protein